MEQKRSRRTLWIVLGVLAILLSICLGAFAGGVAGYWAGRRTAARAVQRYGVQVPQLPLCPSPNLPRGRGLPQSVPSVEGALVTEVTRGSPAEAVGIRVGDVISAIDGKRVGADNTPQALIGGHRPGDSVELTVQSQGIERTVSVKLGSRSDQQDAAYLGISYVLAPQVEDAPAR